MGPVFCLLMWVEAATAATGVAVAPSGFLMPSALYRGLRAVRAVVSQCLAVSRSALPEHHMTVTIHFMCFMFYFYCITNSTFEAGLQHGVPFRLPESWIARRLCRMVYFVT